MLTVYLTARADQTIALKIACADTEIFQSSINSLKFVVPPAARFYDRSSKCWVISEQAAPELEKYLATVSERFDADIVVTTQEDEQRANRRRKQSDPAHDSRDRDSAWGQHRQGAPADWGYDEMNLGWARAVLFVTADAPPEVVQAAYRALAKIYHPDVGGDTASMRLINSAYEVLTAHAKLAGDAPAAPSATSSTAA